MKRHATLPLIFAMTPFAAGQDFDIPFEKFTLDNGLQVILHEDHSDPVVAVYLYYHVGSAREELGRSGFAHLFEHMLFQGSQHVGDDQHFKLIQEAGGTLNGSTNSDRTNYFEILPSNQVELALWLESDRIGFLLPAVTQAKLDNQREVVKNEKRQRVDNRPYGRVREALQAALFEPSHPYSWTTIGSMDDLDAASLEDVHGFFRRWYGPNNLTLAVGGDIDPEAVKGLIVRYFASIPRGPEVVLPPPRPARLEQTRRVVQEDRVQLPQISIAWPTVERFHEDEAAVDVLCQILSANRSSILDRALTIDEPLAANVTINHSAWDLAGFVTITVRPNPDHTLDEMEHRLHELMHELDANGVDPAHLARVKNSLEAAEIRGYETVGRRTSALAAANMASGDPAGWRTELAKRLAVTGDDVQRVLRRYLLDRPAVILSTVPDGRVDLAATGATPEQRVAEETLDRTIMPAPGPEPKYRAPEVWTSTLANGVRVTGTLYDELPLTRIRLSVPAGHLYNPRSMPGLASMTAAMMNEGTMDLGPAELQEALDAIGAELSIGADNDEITISISALDKHLASAIGLLDDILLTPRIREEDFQRLKRERLVQFETRSDSINTIADDAYARLLYGGTAAGEPSIGTVESASAMTLDDVRAFFARHVVPEGARLLVVGRHDAGDVEQLFSALAAKWTSNGAEPVAANFAPEELPAIGKTRIYLVDKPGAAQSQIRIGHRGLASADDDFYGAYIMNYILGGVFSSRINMNLREDKGYTYGARSRFEGGTIAGPFLASAGVRTDVTAESVAEFMKELRGIREAVQEEEVAFTKRSLSQSILRQYESMSMLAAMLNNISKYGYPAHYVVQRLEQISATSPDEVLRLARQYVRPDNMVILIAGDKESVLPALAELGYGDVVELDARGKPLQR
ncbi:MAG: insulinase family protein [Planctomycetota bacterium]|nr:MAG: insulinase family protein [Planctomycetota bacterium]